jgi:hypothetical protein
MTAVFDAHLVSRRHLLTTTPLVGAVYRDVPLYLAGSLFAGSSDATIELSTRTFTRRRSTPRCPRSIPDVSALEPIP